MTPLDRQFEKLKETYPVAHRHVLSAGAVLISIENFPLPPGWSKSATTVRFLVPAGYPAARPDCFWCDGDLRLARGVTPANTNQTPIPGFNGPPLLWFSWHLQSWDPVRDTLLTYVRVIRKRLDLAQ